MPKLNYWNGTAWVTIAEDNVAVNASIATINTNITNLTSRIAAWESFKANGGTFTGPFVFKTSSASDGQITIKGRLIEAAGDALALKGANTENLFFFHDPNWNIDAIIPGADRKWNIGTSDKRINDLHIGGNFYLGPASINASAGYNRLPNGMVIQWGRFDTGNMDNAGTKEVYKEVTFPLSFPTDVFAIFCGVTNNTSSNSGDYLGDFIVNGRVTSLSKARITVRNIVGQLSAATDFEVKWFAIGN